MKSFIFIVLIVAASISYADICICQYPDLDAKYGDANKGEITFYRAGCNLWLAMEKGCRLKRIANINKDLKPFLSKKIKNRETVRLGFVGHWSSSNELIRYLDGVVEPLLKRFRNSFMIDNTACYAMESPQKVYDHIKKYAITKGHYLRVKGNQTTSISMWQTLSANTVKGNFFAVADSRKVAASYPYCSAYHKKRCTKYQRRESASCIKDGKKLELTCDGRWNY